MNNNVINLTDLALHKRLFMNSKFSTKGWIWNPEKLQLIRDVYWTCPININKKWTSKDGFLIIENDEWIFKTGYSWNGATAVPSGETDYTPNLPVISLTTNPIPSLWFPTLVHDIGCDNLNDPTFPFKRRDIDRFFAITSSVMGFSLTKLYYTGVRFFGIFIQIGSWIKSRLKTTSKS